VGEPTQPRNRDQDIPTRSGEEMGECEPPAPQSESEREERYAPLPEDETHEYGRKDKRPAEERLPVEDA
jgi:hypothetical protein